MPSNTLSRLLRDCRECDGWWVGRAHVPFWGGDLEVRVEPEDDGPDGAVVEIVRAILAYPRNLRPAIEREVFRLYLEQAPFERVDYGVDDGRNLAAVRAPRLAEPSQIWRLLTAEWLATWAHDNDPERSAFELKFGCTWDREHGIRVRVERWAVSAEYS